MTKEIITFEQLPQAVSELTTQVMELRNMVSSLQPQVPTEKHRIIGIDDACIITQKAKPTIYTLARKGLIPAYKRGKKLYFYEDELLKWIEEGRKVVTTKSYDEILASMQSTVRNKPKNGFKV
ncbi:helix-turn-helix domain-containing protein [Parabacteroides merdae]|uniref:helix-turn-helix domain-containing protein n=1 Tax=Parabacteroides merdae TaxID=46503 RepID=UPI0018AA9C21|nr:helix-turn-helix domain-containing protein [Parabacteroides merdae]MDB9084349.1 helix-turn-helix domain-containing protein [Parabacteroides merdae]